MTPDNRHQHLIVRAEVNKPPMGDDLEAVCAWLSSVIKNMGMKELAAPRARYCEDIGNRGLTADAILSTSHAALHVWDECSPAILQLDIYTCSTLPVDQVLSDLSQFQPVKIEYKFLDREFGLKILSESDISL